MAALSAAPQLGGAFRDQRNGATIAVLPFDRLVDDANRAHLPWALQDRLTNALATNRSWRVVTLWSASRAIFASGGAQDSAAKLLRAQYIVTGRVAVENALQEVTLELRRVGEEKAVWTASFGKNWTLKGMVGNAAGGIQRALLRAAESTASIAAGDSAYDALAAGDFALLSTTAAGADSARVHYERALAHDPSMAEAATRLAYSLALILERGGSIDGQATPAVLTRAFALTERALRRNPKLAQAWTVRAVIARLRDPVGFGGAIGAHTRAVRLDPNDEEAWHEYGVTMLRRGAASEAESRFRRALQLLPNRPASLSLLADAVLQRNQAAEACLLTNASIDAWSFDPIPYITRARARLILHQTRDAYADAETAEKLTPAPWVQAVHVTIHWRAGNDVSARREATELVARWLRRGQTLPVRDATYLAKALVTVGDRKRAIEAIRRARPQGLDLVVALRDPGLTSIRADTAVARIIREASRVD